MKRSIATLLIAVCAVTAYATASFNTYAQSDVSALSAVSALPLASVVASTAVVAVPVILSVAGGTLVVKTVQYTARGTVYVLERASDGAQASVEVLAKGVAGASLVVGSVVTVSVIGAGVLLSAAGEAIAFIPNALGQALLHNERITN